LRSGWPRTVHPGQLEPGPVLDAVKTWPGNAAPGACRGAVKAGRCAAGGGDRVRCMGRDEETGFQTEQRNRQANSAAAMNQADLGCAAAFHPNKHEPESGQLMCYENRTTLKAYRQIEGAGTGLQEISSGSHLLRPCSAGGCCSMP